MNSATFRAMRDTVGFSRHSIAEALGVTENMVDLWESNVRPVPERAAAWMWGLVAAHDQAVAETVTATMEMIDETNESLGMGPDDKPPISLSYWPTQASYDAGGRDKGDYGAVNARSRAVAAALRGLGYEVEFTYPPSED